MENIIQVEMTSLEIAEVTGKEHFHIMRDYRDKMLPLLTKEDASKNGGIFKVKEISYLDKYEREKPALCFNKYAANAFMANYKLEHAMAVVTHLNTLENKVVQQQEELSVMKNIVWTVINGQNYINQTQALKMAGVKHPNLFMRYLKDNKKFHEDLIYERCFLVNKQVGKTGMDRCWRFTKDGFKWLLTNRENINDWVEKQKAARKSYNF